MVFLKSTIGIIVLVVAILVIISLCIFFYEIKYAPTISADDENF